MKKVLFFALGILLVTNASAFAEALKWDENGNYYDWFTDFSSWDEANAKAENLGGHLATITSQEENDWITSNFSLKSGDQTNNYIGGYQYANSNEPAGGWKWVTPESWSYTNWDTPYQPDNWSSPDGRENYLSLYPNGKWNDYAEKAPYLVEWENRQSVPDNPLPISPIHPSPAPSDVGLWSVHRSGDDNDGDVVSAYFEEGVQNFDPTKDTIILVHGWVTNNVDSNGNIEDSTLPNWIEETVHGDNYLSAQLLGERRDVNVLAWNWTEVASTSYGGATDPLNMIPKEEDPVTGNRWPGIDVGNQGIKLSRDLRNLLGDNYNGEVQFIGHSLGAGVSTVAALNLTQRGVAVDQVTLFDAPEGNGFTPEFAELHLDNFIKQGSQENIWYDNYPTAFGKIYNWEAQSGELNLTDFLIIGERNNQAYHGYPMSWYFGVNHEWQVDDDEGTLDFETGIPNKEVGAIWSHAINNISNDNWIDGVRSEMVNNEIYERQGDAYTLLPYDATEVRDEQHTTEVDIGNSNFWLKQGDVYYTEGVYHLATHSPVYLFSDYFIPIGSDYLTFDFMLDNPLPEDYFSFYIGDDLSFRMWGDQFPTEWDSFINSGPINISQYTGSNQLLTFAYYSEEAERRVRLQNIYLYTNELQGDSNAVPEPATMVLFATGLAGAFFRRRKV